ncbi:MAG: methionyl-tRNA formyltransferase [Nitrospirae bacterium]|nr:methionyl-tRNA formyltransferase [Nitrospirota bacterium]
MKIVFFGTPDFAVPSLKKLIESGEDVVSVVTQPDRVKGRGHTLSAPAVKEYAIAEGIPVLQPAGIRSEEFLRTIAGMKPDMIVVVAYGRIIPPDMLALPQKGCINVHASLLPKYRGAAPIQWSIVRGEKKTGVTTMLMDSGLDTGDILLMEETEILPEDNAMTLGNRLSEMGADLLIATIRGIVSGAVRPVSQAGESSYAPIIRKEDGKIGWSSTTTEIFNLIRGMYPWPGGQCAFEGEKITIIKSRVAAADSGETAGSIVKIQDDELHVGTGKGILALMELKPEGKKTMTGAAFARGRHIREGMQFERQ